MLSLQFFLAIFLFGLFILIKLSHLFNKLINLFLIIGVIFHQNEEGNVTDIQADIVGPCKYYIMITTIWIDY